MAGVALCFLANNAGSTGTLWRRAQLLSPVQRASLVRDTPFDSFNCTGNVSECDKKELAHFYATHNVRLASCNDLSQENLFQRLLPVWGADRPRVLVDLGSHPAFGDMQQYSDGLIFLDYYRAPGTVVLAVDAMPDFAEDLQRRFDDLEGLQAGTGEGRASNVRCMSIAAWVENEDAYDGPVGMQAWPADFAPNRSINIARQLGYCVAGHSYDKYVQYCDLERGGRPAHMCRVTRERLGIQCRPGDNATVAPANRSVDSVKVHPSETVSVPKRTIDSLRKRELHGAHVDLLKVDIEASWSLHYGDGARSLLRDKAVSVMVVEVDRTWKTATDNPRATVAEAVADFVRLCEEHGYAVYLKVPCATHSMRRCRPPQLAAGTCTVHPSHNRTIGNEAYLKLSHEYRSRRLPALIRLQQDLLVIDTAQPELIQLADAHPPPCRAEQAWSWPS